VQGEVNKDARVLDLGSGKGGAARLLAKRYGCHVTCLNLGSRQNEFNKIKAAAEGIGHLIEPVLGSFNEPLPADWTDSFDLVWSQEAFCHAMDHNALISEIQRVLKPGGTMVFSDIMQGDSGGDCSSFTGQNVTTKLATPQKYKVPLLNISKCKTANFLLNLRLSCTSESSRSWMSALVKGGVSNPQRSGFKAVWADKIWLLLLEKYQMLFRKNCLLTCYRRYLFAEEV
jgi:SAM-dependent methyltransferase